MKPDIMLHRPYTMADVNDKFNLTLRRKILSIAAVKSLRILVAKFTVCDKLHVLNNEVSNLFDTFYYNPNFLHHKL